MSDLAPIFTNVAEALRCQTVQDLKNENEDLKNENEDLQDELLNKTRIVVNRVGYVEEPRMERTVAEGIMEKMEILTSADIPEKYSTLFDGDEQDDEGRYYAVKLRTTDAWIDTVFDFDVAYVVRMNKGNSSVILGVLDQATIHEFKHGCLLSMLVHLEQDKTKTMVEVQQPTKKSFLPYTLAYKVIPFDNHPYWNDIPRRKRPEGRKFDHEYNAAANEFIENAPENSAERVFEYLFFRPIEVSEFLDTLY